MDAGHHAFTPTSVAKVGNHLLRLDTLAQGVGQHAFQSVACVELNATLVGDEQDDQAVIFVPFAYTPRVEQFVAEVEALRLADAGHDGHYRFDARLLLQAVEHTVDAVGSRRTDDTFGVAQVAVFVLDMYLGEIVRRVDFLLGM